MAKVMVGLGMAIGGVVALGWALWSLVIDKSLPATLYWTWGAATALWLATMVIEKGIEEVRQGR
jgi:hypothetical protein